MFDTQLKGLSLNLNNNNIRLVSVESIYKFEYKYYRYFKHNARYN